MIYAVVGDIHLGTRSANEYFLDFQFNWLSYFINECKKNNVERIIQLGDFFDVRKSTDNQLLDGLINFFIPMIKEAGIPWDVLVGNHDIYYKNTNRVNTVSILSKLVNDSELFTVHANPFLFDSCLYVPWLNEENIEYTLSLVDKADYVFGHFEFSGFRFSNNKVEMDRYMYDFNNILSRYGIESVSAIHEAERMMNIIKDRITT